MPWYQLLSIRKEAQQEFQYYADRPPYACPNCGEPLREGPTSQEGTLYCKFDGWQYPRDWFHPENPYGSTNYPQQAG